MGLTYLEASKTEMEPARRALINELSSGELLGIIPFEDTDGGGVLYDKVESLPSIGFRALNETFGDPTYGVTNPQADLLKLMGDDVDVDTALISFHGESVIDKQVAMKIQSLRMTFEDAVINGDETKNPRAFDGLRKRINIGSSQAINAGGALSLGAVDEVIDAVDAGDSEKVLIMNRALARRFSQAARNITLSGYIRYEQLEFGRRALYYGDCRIIRTKVNAANQEIQPFTETDGVANSSSIYCVAFGDLLTTGIHGKVEGETSYGPSIQRLGKVPDAPVDRTRIEWYPGMAIYNGRSAARLYGVTNSALVA